MSKKPTKILFLGLDNSGKTSIVLSLQKNINLLDYTSLKPTKGFDITEFEEDNSKFHIWDFGGQEQYRDDHLQKLNTYLTETNKIIYVIDIQDKNRYDLSIQYFEEILNILNKESLLKMIKLSIFLHKFDPDLEIEEKLVTELINKIVERIPKDFDYNLFKTSIFTVFRKISIL